MSRDIREDLKEVKAAIAKKFPAFYIFLQHFDIYYVEEKDIGFNAAITDNGKIIITEDFFERDFTQKCRILVHELMHYVLKHPYRFPKIIEKYSKVVHPAERLHSLINDVADWIIDVGYLSESFPIPKYKKEMFSHIETTVNVSIEEMKKMSLEELFDKYFKKLIQKGIGCNSLSSPEDIIIIVSCNCSQCSSLGSILSKAVQLQKGIGTPKSEEEAQQAFINSLMSAKLAGSKISSIEEFFINQLLKPKINWKSKLKKKLFEYAGKYIVQSWKKINRRLPSIVPGIQRLGNSKVWCLVDISGSTWEEFPQFVSEVASIANFVEDVEFITWDTKITGRYTVKQKNQLLKIKFRGRGGTEFYPVISELKREIKPTHLVIVLTDGYWFDEKKACEVLEKIRAEKILVTTDRVISKGFNTVIEVKV